MTRPIRTIRFIAKEDGKLYYGEPTQEGDIGLLYHSGDQITAKVLTSSPLSDDCNVTSQVKTVDKLLTPLDRSEVGTIRGLGAQYRKPGTVAVKPAYPIVFFKPLTTLTNPEEPIVLSKVASKWETVWEAELCIVIGKDAKDVAVEDAFDYVLGYCCANDVTGRLQPSGIVNKSFDTWSPIGPVLVSKVSNPDKLKVTAHVNGVLKQDTNTSEMVLSVAEIISTLSGGITLEKGSLILTGTADILNLDIDPKPFLKEADQVQIFVEELGTLFNPVREEK